MLHFYLQWQVAGQIGSVHHSLLTPGLEQSPLDALKSLPGDPPNLS